MACILFALWADWDLMNYLFFAFDENEKMQYFGLDNLKCGRQEVKCKIT